MDLSIIITHYKTPDLLKSCIESAKKSLKSLDYEIIVADSEALREIREIISKNFPGVEYLPFKGNVGYAKLVNAGLEKARGNFILIINADIIIKEDAILKLIEFLKGNSDVGLVAPRLVNPDGTFQQTCFRFYTSWTIICRRTFFGKTFLCKNTLEKFLMKKELSAASPKENGVLVDWLMGSALMTTRKAVDKVGPMDERYFMYFEDVDWSRRFLEAGLKVIYFPGAQMLHLHKRESYKKGGVLDLFSNKYARIHLISAIKYFLKWILR